MNACLALAALLAAEPVFLKGQLHLHSSNSGDSATPPTDVVRWYAARGYDFIVFTDHNHVTAFPSPGPSSSSSRSPPPMLVIPGVELTQNVERCTPPPPPGSRCLLHVNALFVTPPPGGTLPWPAPAGPDRLAIFRRALAVTRRLGGIAQLNHPNFHYAADASAITALARDGLILLEVANASWDVNNVPDDRRRPSTEALWDATLAAGATVFATATDDAHHYFDAAAAAARGEGVFPGDLGYVMVRARKDPAAIRAALERGDFYASTGVKLGSIESTGARLSIAIDPASAGAHRFELIGPGGRVLARQQGQQASFPIAAAPGSYVRAVVVDDQRRRAWLQPIRDVTAAAPK